MTTIERLKCSYQSAKPKSRRKIELGLRLRDQMTKQLRKEIRADRRRA